jgi:hypothetical protein
MIRKNKMKKRTNLFKDRERYPFWKIFTTDFPQIIPIKGSKEFYVNSLQKKRIILNIIKPSKNDIHPRGQITSMKFQRS